MLPQIYMAHDLSRHICLTLLKYIFRFRQCHKIIRYSVSFFSSLKVEVTITFNDLLQEYIQEWVQEITFWNFPWPKKHFEIGQYEIKYKVKTWNLAIIVLKLFKATVIKSNLQLKKTSLANYYQMIIQAFCVELLFLYV